MTQSEKDANMFPNFPQHAEGKWWEQGINPQGGGVL